MLIGYIYLLHNFSTYFKCRFGIKVATLGCNAKGTIPHDDGMPRIVFGCG